MNRCINPSCDNEYCKLKPKQHKKCPISILHKKTSKCLYYEESDE